MTAAALAGAWEASPSCRSSRCADGPGREDDVGGERGAASLLAVALIGVVLLLGMAANLVIAAAAAHRSAQAAADLAALAGAQAWQQRSDVTSACGVARTVAELNDAGLTDCRLEGDDLLAVVRVAGPQLFGQEFEIVGRARAGPEAAQETKR